MLIGKGKAVRTPEFHKKMERKRLIKMSLYSILFIIIAIVPIYLLRTSKFLISNIEIQGNSVTKSEELQAIIGKDLEGNYALVFPRSNTLLYPKKKLAADLLLAIPRLKSAKISRINSKSIQVVVEERVPYALYCRDIENPLDPQNCFFLDDTGYIFSEAPSFSSGVYFVYSSNPSFDPPLRQQYLNPDKFKHLNPFIDSLSGVGLYPKLFVTKNDEYNLILSNGAVIMWKNDQDLSKIKSNLESFMSDQSFTKDKANLNNLLYIDLRFGNKIFYKFRDSI